MKTSYLEHVKELFRLSENINDPELQNSAPKQNSE